MSRSFFSLWIRATVVMLIGLLGVACAADSSPAAAPAPAPAATAAPAPEPAPTAAPEAVKDILQEKLSRECDGAKAWWRDPGTPVRGGTFTWAARSRGAPVVYDHLRGGQALDQVNSRLLQTRSCFYEDTAVEPDMVESWDVSADGLTWTLKVRSDIKWHNQPPVNGRAFTSADIGWTIDLIATEGAERSVWDKMTHEEPDAQTVILTLEEVQPDFLLSNLGARRFLIMPREVYEENGDFKSHMVGTGPFMLETFQWGVLKEFVRNPDWPEMGADGKALPYLDSIRTVYVDDNASEIAAIRSGQIDRSALQTVLKTDADSLKAEYPKARFSQDVTGCPWGGWINPHRKPFDDVRVRKAIALALDQEEMIQGALDGGSVPTGFLPVAITDFAWPISKVKEKFVVDLDESKRLLAEAGYGPDNPLKFKLHSGETGGDSRRTEVAQQQLKRVGVQAEIELLELNSSSYLNQRALAEGKYDSMWGTQSPCEFRASRWMGTQLLSDSFQNCCGFNFPEVDKLARQQMTELDPVKRGEILNTMQDVVFELTPYFPTGSRTYFRYQHCRLKNMAGIGWYNALTGMKEAWKDETNC